MYVSTLCAYQPHKGPDMLAYLHVIASEHEEFQFAACMAYNVAFTKMAANFRLSSWGHIDPQVFSKHLPALARQSLVLTAPFAYPISIALLTALCTPVGQPRRHRLAWLASNVWSPSTTEKRYLNFNRSRCSRENCTRAHACSFRTCGGTHPATQCTLRRSSPKKR